MGNWAIWVDWRIFVCRSASTTTIGYDFLNRRSTITDAASGVTTFGYNLAGQLTSLRDPDNNDTVYTRDLLGRVTREENELGHSRYFVYDAASNLTLKKDRNSRLTAYSFDDLNRLESENWLTGTTSLPSLAVATTTQGGPVNEVQRVGMTVSMAFTSGTFTLSFGGQTTSGIAYNASAATVQTALAALSSIGSGNISATKSQNTTTAQEWTLTFQGSLAGANQSQVTINSSGVMGFMTVSNIQATDTNGNSGVNEVQTVTLSNATAGTFRLAFGNEFTDDLAYNASSSDVGVALAALPSIGSGNVSVSGSAGGPYTVTFQGALAGINVAAIQGDASHATSGSIGRTIAFTFDDASQLTDVSDPSADYAFGYDDVGRTTSITADLDGFTQSIVMANTFDAASNRTQLAASIGSTADFVDDFSFDNLLRMTRIERQGVGGGNTVAEIRVDMAYNALSQFATIDRYADLAGTKLAVTSTYGYDGANRLASLYHTQSTNDLAKYDFTWDNADRLTSIDSLQDGVTNFTYDVTNQLTAADFATQTDETHAWTANGNPTGGSYTVTANNRVSTDGTYNYTYDNEGNRTRKTKISDGSYTDYVWDHRNRLMSVISKTSGGTITQQVDYVYDFLNQLITRTIDADGAGAASPTSQWFAYSDGQIVLSFDSSSATTPDHRYLWGPQVDQLVADENSTNDLLYPLGDQVGTLRDIAQYDDGTDTTTVVNHVIFSSFNAQLSSSNSAYDILFGQTGRLHDAATGLDNHLNRWLDAWLKRWMSEDPIGFGGGDANLRRYVGNRVITSTDSSGLAEQSIDDYLQKIDAYLQGQICYWLSSSKPNPALPAPASGTISPTIGNKLTPWVWTPIVISATSKPVQIARLGEVEVKNSGKRLVGVGGGDHQVAGLPLAPNTYFGVGGAWSCIGVVVVCPNQVVAFHFQSPDDAAATIGQYTWPTGCTAVICGGNNTAVSNHQLTTVIDSLKSNGIEPLGAVDMDACFYGSDGNWYIGIATKPSQDAVKEKNIRQ